jgi:hypothetical protein
MDNERKLCVSAIEKDNIIQTNYLHTLIDSLYCLPTAIVTTIIYKYIPQYSGETLEDIIDVYDLICKYHGLQTMNNFFVTHINIVSDEIYVSCKFNDIQNIYVINKKNKLIDRHFSVNEYAFIDVYKNEIFVCLGKLITVIDKYSGKINKKYFNEKGYYRITYTRDVTSYNDEIYFLECGESTGNNTLHVFNKDTKEFSITGIKEKYTQSYNCITVYDNEMYITNRNLGSSEIRLDCLNIINPTKIIPHYLNDDCYIPFLPTNLIVTDNEIIVSDYMNCCIRIFNKFTKKSMRKIKISEIRSGRKHFYTVIEGDQIFITYDNKIHVFNRIIIN